MREGAILRANVFGSPGAHPATASGKPRGIVTEAPWFSKLQDQGLGSDRYVIVVDLHGADKSPGKLDINSIAKFRRFYDVIL